MNKYEVAVVLSSTLTDEARNAELDVIKGYIAKYEGTVTDVDEWGKPERRFLLLHQSRSRAFSGCRA